MPRAPQTQSQKMVGGARIKQTSTTTKNTPKTLQTPQTPQTPQT